MAATHRRSPAWRCAPSSNRRAAARRLAPRVRPQPRPVASGVVAEASVDRRFNVRIPLRDGITLSADLALPGQLPAPAVVVRTPYGKEGERQSKRGEVFARAGYACLHVDVRGRGDSDGTFEPYRNDGRDGADAIAWVAARGEDIVPVIGARRRDRLKEALDALDVTLNAGDMAAIEAAARGTTP